MTRPTLKPLSLIELLFYPLLMMFARGQARYLLKKRLKYRKFLIKKRNDERKAIVELHKESVAYADIIQHRWTALGEAWIPREWDPLAVMMPIRKNRKKKVQKVRFERIRDTPEIIWLQIKVSSRGLFGYRTHLPYGVTVTNLTTEDTLRELAHACRRKIEAATENERSGAWLKVHRLEGLGGLPRLVTFREMLPLYPADISTVPIVLGIGANRTPHIVPLAKLPHTLIGGATGGGKSNMVNALILQWMYFYHPKDLKLILIDLKNGMEFASYRGGPHIEGEIVINAAAAKEKLEEMVKEIERRNSILQGQAKELSIWNEMYPDRAMPRLIIVIDEYAQLVLGRDRRFEKETQDAVASITSLGRAVGVHCVICTQYPIKDVVPSLVKANAAIKIAFKMQNQTQSMVIINVGDAAFLPAEIKGRMCYVTEAVTHEVQTPLVSDDDIKLTLRIARGRQAGVISLAGIEPTIEFQNLLRYIATTLDGNLAISKLSVALREFAIDTEMAEGFVGEVAKHKEIRIDNHIYKVTQKNGAYRLVLEVSNDLPEEVLQALEVEVIREDPPPSAIELVKEPIIIEQTIKPKQQSSLIVFDDDVQKRISALRMERMKAKAK